MKMSETINKIKDFSGIIENNDKVYYKNAKLFIRKNN